MNSSESPRSVNVGLIGVGGRLRGIVERIVREDARIRIVSAYDPDPGSREPLREVLGYDCRHTASEEEVANDPAVDWVFIGSWNCQHARHAILALDAGKHVFCEKPLATSLDDCLAIREAAERSGRTFAFGLVLRYSAHYQAIEKAVRSGAIGRIVSFEFNETLGFNHGGYIFGNWRRERKNAGTHLLEKCCHDLDLVNWIVGALPVRVASFGGRDFFTPANAGAVERVGPGPKGETAYRAWPGPDQRDPFDGGGDIFDNQVAILQYANGVRGTFHTNCNAAIPERRMYFCGTEGTLRADLVASTLEIKRIDWEEKIEKIDSSAVDGHGGGDPVMAASLARTLLCGEPPLASVREGIQSAVAAFGIDEAVDSGCLVDLTPMWQRAGIDPEAAR